MAYLPQPVDLPKYNPSGYSAPANPSGAYMRLPVEKTVGGVERNPWNPGYNPYPAGFSDPTKEQYLNPDFNPYTQGYFSGGEFKPYLPDKIVYGHRDNNLGAPGIGQASQMINGKWYNIGANNFEAGKTSAEQRPFETSAPSVAPSETAAAPFTGMMFGSKWYEGLFDQNKFYVNQPKQPTTTNPDLGFFKPWNPALNALQQSRSQP